MTRSPLSIRPARHEEGSAISEFLNRAFGQSHSFERRQRLWTWRSVENPARSETIPGFLVAHQDNSLVAVHGLMPLRMKIYDSVLTASCSCDLAADSSARTAGMRIKLAAMSPEISVLHFSTSANRPANAITLALGGKEVPGGRRKLIKPLRVSGLLGKRVGARMEAAGRAAAFAVKPLDGIFAVSRNFRQPRNVDEDLLEEPRGFDERFDRLWDRVAKRYDVAVIRDAAYLDWRYSRYPFAGIRSLALVRRDEVVGFTAWHSSIDEDGLAFGAILELLSPHGETAALNRLLAETERRASSNGAHYLIAQTLDPDIEAALRRRRFRIRESAHSPVTVKNNTGRNDADLTRDGAWYLSLGDGDSCFYFD